MRKEVLLVYVGLAINVDEGAKHRLNSFINEYNKIGFKVTVLAFCKKGLFLKDKKRYLNSNASWLLLPYILPMSKNIVLFNILLLYLRLTIAIISWLKKYDVIQMEMYSIKSRICRKRSFYITDFHGDAVAEFIEMKGRKITHWFAKKMLYMQSVSLKTSDFCICVSENLKKQLENNTNVLIDRYGIISCGVDFDYFESSITPLEYKDIINEKIVLGYSGGLQKWQNIDKIINIVARLREIDSNIYLMIFTNHSIDIYKKLLLKIGEENYNVKALKAKDIPSYLKLFDAGFLLRDNWVLNKVSSPTKMCEYLAAGVPVICTQYSGDYARSVFFEETGFILDGTDVTDLELKRIYSWLRMVKAQKVDIEKNCKREAAKRVFKAEFALVYKQIRIS